MKPLYLSVKQENLDQCLENINKEDSPLIYACRLSKLEIIKALINAGDDVNKSDNYGVTPLMAAIEKDYNAITFFLLDHGADVNSCDRFGNTPLIYAITKGRKTIVKKLIALGADVNKCNNENCSPLLFASRNNSISIVKILLQNKADINLGKSLLSTTVHHDSREKLVKLLIKNNADVNKCDSQGRSLIYLASWNNHSQYGHNNSKIVKLLIDQGVDINKCNNDGKSPLFASMYTLNLPVAKILIEHGAIDYNDAALKFAEDYIKIKCCGKGFCLRCKASLKFSELIDLIKQRHK